jgi:Transglycosylase-like domain
VTAQLASAMAQQRTATTVAAEQTVQTRGGTPSEAPSDPPLNAFLQCVVRTESGGNYAAVSPDGLYMGAFQFSQPTWNEAASLAGLPGLVGVPPNLASKADQDTLAVALYNADGKQPWLDGC